jgi:hypothetical protein
MVPRLQSSVERYETETVHGMYKRGSQKSSRSVKETCRDATQRRNVPTAKDEEKLIAR